MEVVHDTGSLSVRRSITGNLGFLLTNKKGSYCSFFNEQNSRYDGLFYFDEKEREMYKFIESIEVKENSSIISLKNYFYYAERWKDKITESFLMPSRFSSLMYRLSNENEIDVILDCKKSYDNREWGRNYGIFEEKGCIVVKFTKKTDKREDKSCGVSEFILYLAIKSDNCDYKRNDKWVEREYISDEERKSPPFKRHVYNALRLKGSKFVFSMSKSKRIAVEEALNIFSRFDDLKSEEKDAFAGFLKNENIKRVIRNDKASSEIKIAYINALNSLNNLSVCPKKCKGIFAGLPWFFQFWDRDTLISLKSLSKIMDTMPVIFDYLNRINSSGRLSGADSHGWLFFRCYELAENHKCLYEIESSLEKSLSFLQKSRTSENFEINDAKETWMDTEFRGDERKGIRIEIQALRLRMYRLMYELSQNRKYMALENILKNKLREKFFNGKILADGIDDFTARPNIFIAAYVYPDFLSNEEWETCLGNALESIWLDWGGVSTIDKNSPLYSDVHTGEDVKSYHRGDSWFWINNLAALVLNRTDKSAFSGKIKKIIEASTEEILWMGCIGCHSELSSARELFGKGCFSQSWSNAMYLEMIDEVYENFEKINFTKN